MRFSERTLTLTLSRCEALSTAKFILLVEMSVSERWRSEFGLHVLRKVMNCCALENGIGGQRV